MTASVTMLLRNEIIFNTRYLDRRGISCYYMPRFEKDRSMDDHYLLRKRKKDMSITADLIRGHTDAIILTHLRKGDSYGYQINKAILEKTDGQ